MIAKIFFTSLSYADKSGAGRSESTKVVSSAQTQIYLSGRKSSEIS